MMRGSLVILRDCPMNATPRKVYIVQRLTCYYRPDARVEGVFTTRADAETRLAECERALRPTLRYHGLFWDDPHTYHSPRVLTDFDLPVFLDWLRDADIPLPANPEADRNWDRWWEEQRDRLTEPQLCHLFAGLHRLTFHEIVEVDLVDDPVWDPVKEVAEITGVALTGNGPAEFPDEEPPQPPDGEATPDDIPFWDMEPLDYSEDDIPF
jgi:hypothetical protein